MNRAQLLYNIWIVLEKTLPSKMYLSLKYRVIFKRKLNWKSPKTFSEKLQWIKLYGCRPEYQEMVDKVAVKEYIDRKLGPGYVFPIYGKYSSFDEIDFDSLPNQFVLKCNHDSGAVVLCKNKDFFDREEAKRRLEGALHRNYYLAFRETPYKHVKPVIFAEQFMQNDGLEELLDYKFFCFHGEPKIMKVDFGRTEGNHHANYYDMDMNLLPFGLSTSYPLPDKEFSKPDGFDEMVDIAKRLSKDIPFVRVDLYNVSGKIYFGEFTFFPASGLTPYTDESADLMLGSWLHLPTDNA